MTTADRLHETIDAVRAEADGDTVPLGDILDEIEERGFGPLVMVLAAFVVLPTGVIPGIPAIVGLCLLLLGGQMMAGKTRPWFPDKIEQFGIKTDTLKNATDTARPWAKRLEALLRQRLTVLCNGPVATRVSAACIIVAALLMIPLGFVPFLPLVLGLAMLILGIGITARDGVVVALGYAVFALGCWLAWRGI